MKKPTIGVVCIEYRDPVVTWYPKRFSIIQTYIEAIENAGGLPFIIPLTAKDTLMEMHSRLDGLVLGGGGDIHPQFYGEEPSGNLDRMSMRQDRVELAMAGWSILERKPTLGICRGMQIINVALGGTLHQDIATEVKTDIDHNESFTAKDFSKNVHDIILQPGSRTAKALGTDRTAINSLHHQAIKDLAPDLRVVGTAPDGIIEAVEGKQDMYLVGIQAHPEVMARPEDSPWRNLFSDFVEECSSNRQGRLAKPVPLSPSAQP